MNLLSMIVIGIGLSVDSLAASITTGALSKSLKLRRVLKIALFMALFQGVMPLVGLLVGSSFRQEIEAYDHWVAFSLLLLIGGKLIYDSLYSSENPEAITYTKNLTLAGMALATSIDAMVIGIGFGLMDVNIWMAMLIIGLITFVFSSLGVIIGEKIGCRVNKGIGIIGGIVLISLGTKILIEHLYF